MNTFVAEKLPEIKNIFLKYNSKSAYLFGSASKNNFTDSSDVDFLFTFDENLDYEKYSDNYFALQNELEKLLERKIDLVAEKTVKNIYLLESINQSKINIL